MAKKSLGLLSLLSLALLSSHTPALAGSFGGPAPFRNGSPLVSGTDGVYQAVATGKNATGIISWSITSGVQSSSNINNDWSFFVDGQILNGTTEANISQGRVVGILNSGLNNDLADTSQIIIVPGNAGSGSFNAKIDFKSPVSAFKGKGVIDGTPERTDQIVIITEGTSGENPTPPRVIIQDITIPGSTLQQLNFKVRGTRLSTSVATSRTN